MVPTHLLFVYVHQKKGRYLYLLYLIPFAIPNPHMPPFFIVFLSLSPIKLLHLQTMPHIIVTLLTQKSFKSVNRCSSK